MKIAIDCRHIDSSGIGVYTRECLPYFLNSPNDFLLLGDLEVLNIFSIFKNAEIIDCPVKTFSLHELIAFPWHIKRKVNACDAYYTPYFNIPGGIRIPVFVTMHDIVFLDMPDLVSPIGYYARKFFYYRAIKKCRETITISEFSKERILSHFGRKKNVFNASNAVVDYSGYYKFNDDKENIILFIGNIKTHKGLKFLLNAYIMALREGLDYNLYIIGEKDNFRTYDKDVSILIDSIDNDKIRFTGHISETEKWQLLQKSAVLVQPSLYEGFCYPPLEAMYSGTCVILSDIQVFKEIYSDFPVTFFRSGDSADLKEKIMEMLHNRLPHTITLPPELRDKYTFKNTVEAILKEMENCVK